MAASLKGKRTPITTPPYQVPSVDITPDPPIFSLVTTFKAVCKSAGSQTGRSLKRMSMDDPDLIRSGQYLSIRAGRKAANTTTAIDSTGRGEGVHMKVEEGDFCNAGDKRILKTTLRFRLDEMMVVSCSFEPGSMMCTNCENRGKHSALNSYDGGPVVFIGTDQHFPATRPALTWVVASQLIESRTVASEVSPGQ
jgi:hypothetical protein